MNFFVVNGNKSQTIQVMPELTIQSVLGCTSIISQARIYSPHHTFSALEDNSVIIPIALVTGGMQIFIRLLNGKNISIDLPSEDTLVEEIKKLIYEKEKINIEAQALYCAGKQMLDGHYITEYNIQAETIVHLIVNASAYSSGVSNIANSQTEKKESSNEESSPPIPFQIMIEGSKGSIALELPNRENTTISNVKQMISEKSGGQAKDYNLFFLSKNLAEGNCLKDYNIPNSSIITMVILTK